MTIIGTTSLVQHHFSVVLVMLNYQHHQVLDKLHTAQVEHTELTNTNAHTNKTTPFSKPYGALPTCRSLPLIRISPRCEPTHQSIGLDRKCAHGPFDLNELWRDIPHSTPCWAAFQVPSWRTHPWAHTEEQRVGRGEAEARRITSQMAWTPLREALRFYGE